MSQIFHTAIVIPCYNEGQQILPSDYGDFLKEQSNAFICFVNDGSTDNTIHVLEQMKENYSSQVNVISINNNVGKAEAVRQGFIYCNENLKSSYISYLDADLSVSLEECFHLSKHLEGEIEFCFGSRILRLGSVIERKKWRFLVGRVVATCISRILRIKVYDTQCGCKVFTQQLSKEIFTKPFISKWLFDVEIFCRIIQIYGKEKGLEKMLEVPLLKWINKGKSEVKLTYFFKLWIDLIKINKTYKAFLKERT